MTTQISSMLAVAGGALLGALAAIVGPGGADPAPPPGAQEPFRPVAVRSRTVSTPSAATSAATSPATASAAPSAPAPMASASPARAGLPEWEREPLEDSPEARRATELRCARGNSMDCMRVGVAYYYGRGMAPKEKQGKLFLARARKLLVISCEKRDPGSCLALAHIHTEGIGVPRNPTNAAALLDLAKTFCKVNPRPACDGL